MEEDRNNSLFEIKLTDSGILYIQKISKLILILYICITLIYVRSVVTDIIFIIRQVRNNFLARSTSLTILNIVYFLLSNLNFAAGIVYVRFFRKLNSSIARHDEIMFNSAFKYVYRNAVLFLASLLIGIVLGIRYFIITLSQ